jgi:hypothetical protein
MLTKIKKRIDIFVGLSAGPENGGRTRQPGRPEITHVHYGKKDFGTGFSLTCDRYGGFSAGNP